MTGIDYRLPFPEYLAHPAISQSGIKTFMRSPAHYRHERDNPREDTDYFMAGRAVHALALEGRETFESGFIVAPQVDRRTRAGKAAWAEFQEQAGDRAVLTADQGRMVEAMGAALNGHEMAQAVITGGGAATEVTGFAMTEDGALERKARADVLRQDGIVADLKTTQDASPEGFRRAVARYGYHVQAAWYLDTFTQASGQEFDSFVFIAIEKEPPYGIGVYELAPSAIERGRELYRNALDRLAQCIEHNAWPSYAPEMMTLDIPAYAYHDTEGEAA